jgi:hypothetical protein
MVSVIKLTQECEKQFCDRTAQWQKWRARIREIIEESLRDGGMEPWDEPRWDRFWGFYLGYAHGKNIGGNTDDTNAGECKDAHIGKV